MTWRRASMARVQEKLRDPDAGEADRCALLREWLRLSGKGVLDLPEGYERERTIVANLAILSWPSSAERKIAA